MLAAAFAAARVVGVGVTTDAFLARHPKPAQDRIQSFRIRWNRLERYLRERYSGRKFWLSPLGDEFGRSVEPEVDVLVVSSDTHMGGRRVNAARTRRGLPRLRIVRVPLVRGVDGLPVSSRRIRAGAIDPLGRRREAVQVRLLLVGGGRARCDPRPWVRAAFPGIRYRLRVDRRAGPLTDRGAGQWARAGPEGDEVRIALVRRRPDRWTATIAASGIKRLRRRQWAERARGAWPPLRSLLP